ncbi:MAG: two-component system, cell cycle sensor histidine kinase and response regulator CckA, partial [Thermodesulfobacteriota bacterium]|nr:two-component system, cell cycle sensor histidine kinase and response regulator CckA [Thermodesulfobacteriota bacterium]
MRHVLPGLGSQCGSPDFARSRSRPDYTSLGQGVSYQAFSGLLFGSVALIGMMTPVHLVPGVIFDGRSIVLSVAGLFGGPISAGVAALISACYRLWLGGAGALMGVSVILESAFLGVVFYYLRRRYPEVTRNVYLLGFGVLVHAGMLVLTLALPTQAMIKTLEHISLPVILIYPPATWLICRLFLDQESRMSAVQALHESEGRYRNLYDGSPDMLLSVDAATGLIVQCNQTCCDRTGFTRTEIVGRAVLEMYHPDDRSDVMKCFQVFRDVGEVRNEEFRVLRKDGTTVDVMLNASAVRDEKGEILYSRSSWRDITERRQAEKALRESEERFRKLVEHCPVGMSVADTSGEIIYLNKKFTELFGYGLQDIPKLNDWWSLAYPDPQLAESVESEWWGRIREAEKSGGQLPPVDREVRCKDGSTRVVEFRKSVIDKWVVHTLIDVTETRYQEERLRASEERHRRISSVMSDIAYSCVKSPHTAYTIDWVTGATERVVGYSPDELKNMKCWRNIVVEEDLPRFDGNVTGIDPNTSAHCELRLRRKDGEEIWVSSVVQCVMDPDSPDGLRLYGGLVDTTEQKKLGAQLLQSHKMQAVGTLAVGIAHDFNNMLQVILGYADLLLLDKKREEPGYQELQRIIKTAQDARDLIQQIRIFSRKADIQTARLDVNYNIDQVVRQLKHTLPKTVRVHVYPGEELAVINADSGLMNQMLTNLAINAAEAMPDGGTLTIRSDTILLDDAFCKGHLGVTPGLHVLLTVSDTGKGIAKDRLERLFDPFYSTKMRDYHKGTGLGLPVVRGIVEMHKGFIDVESELGGGPTFRIYLPAIEVAGSTKQAEEIAPLPKGTETILLVEDEDLVRNLGKYALEQF